MPSLSPSIYLSFTKEVNVEKEEQQETKETIRFSHLASCYIFTALAVLFYDLITIITQKIKIRPAGQCGQTRAGSNRLPCRFVHRFSKPIANTPSTMTYATMSLLQTVDIYLMRSYRIRRHSIYKEPWVQS